MKWIKSVKWIDDAGFLAKRLWSVRMAVFGMIWAGAAGLWVALPSDVRPTLSEPVRWVLLVVGVLVASSPGIAVLVHQPKLAEDIEKRQDASARGAL